MMRWLDEVAGLVAGTVIILGIAFWVVMGTVPQAQASGCTQMRASWYGTESGSRTANGERFTGESLTAAHRSLPFGTKLRVTYQGKSVVVRINDRGPAKWTKRDLDLSRAAAARIGLIHAGVGTVRVCRV